MAGGIPAFMFHGFSRSEGLLPEIFAINGYVSVGAAILNDHAVNYRGMAVALPDERLLVESDSAWDDDLAHQAQMDAIVNRFAALRGTSPESLAALISSNIARFLAV